ncbi:hypothetical protein OF117_11175 [Geodermatophilus sp. YIM 151500]|uniref:hypothetical protein n=1 Tax=Geodermatophilus sp. YIM 151500 TaxID=2984531 RepID=UPI0021E384F8|nr:hypothetical protein [Geodermatophilus sp. YIM 151500]MCV2489925.1 hypothetical protein [Geodermatophilus sp. YIM 151500]
MRRIAVLSVLVLAGGLTGSSAAVAAEADPGVDHQWIGVEDTFALVLPDGQTFTGDEEAPPPEEGIQPGTQVFIGEALYATDDGETLGDEIGRTHIECLGQAVPDNLVCDIAFVLDSGSQLHGTVHVDFSTPPENETDPFQLDIAVTGGTGDFSGATGEVALLDITPTDDPNAEVTTLYEAALVLP